MASAEMPTKSVPTATPPPAKFVSPKTLALYAILTALTMAITMTLMIPLPTRGYFNVGDSMVFFSAFTFGWRAGMICGGIGSAMADILLGYGFFAPWTLIAKGTEGFAAGFLGRIWGDASWARVLGIWIGGSYMVMTYFVAEWNIFGIGYAFAELPFNIAQVLIGGLIGLSLSRAIAHARASRKRAK